MNEEEETQFIDTMEVTTRRRTTRAARVATSNASDQVQSDEENEEIERKKEAESPWYQDLITDQSQCMQNPEAWTKEWSKSKKFKDPKELKELVERLKKMREELLEAILTIELSEVNWIKDREQEEKEKKIGNKNQILILRSPDEIVGMSLQRYLMTHSPAATLEWATQDNQYPYYRMSHLRRLIQQVQYMEAMEEETYVQVKRAHKLVARYTEHPQDFGQRDAWRREVMANIEKRLITQITGVAGSGKTETMLDIVQHIVTQRTAGLVIQISNSKIQNAEMLRRMTKKGIACETFKVHDEQQLTKLTKLTKMRRRQHRQTQVIQMTFTGLFTTTGLAVRRMHMDEEFIVYVEEAGNINQTDLYQIMTCGAKHIFIVGDKNQGIVDKEDVFEWLREEGGRTVDLWKSFRMAMGGNRTQQIVAQYTANLANPEAFQDTVQLIWISDKNPTTLDGQAQNQEQGHHSKYNRVEAEAAMRLKRALIERFSLDESEVLIMTTYAGQRDIINEMKEIKEQKWTQAQTVGSSGGREATVSIVSSVRRRGTLGMLSEPGITNIACTRARRMTLILGERKLIPQGRNLLGMLSEKTRTISLTRDTKSITQKAEERGHSPEEVVMAAAMEELEKCFLKQDKIQRTENADSFDQRKDAITELLEKEAPLRQAKAQQERTEEAAPDS